MQQWLVKVKRNRFVLMSSYKWDQQTKRANHHVGFGRKNVSFSQTARVWQQLCWTRNKKQSKKRFFSCMSGQCLNKLKKNASYTETSRAPFVLLWNKYCHVWECTPACVRYVCRAGDVATPLSACGGSARWQPGQWFTSEGACPLVQLTSWTVHLVYC